MTAILKVSSYFFTLFVSSVIANFSSIMSNATTFLDFLVTLSLLSSVTTFFFGGISIVLCSKCNNYGCESSD